LPSRFGDLPDGRETARAERRARLIAAYEADDRDLLLRSEYLSFLRDPAEIDALLADAWPRFDGIRAMAYLRDPAACMSSTLQQAAQHNDVPDAPFDRMYPRYRPRFRPWIAALLPKAVRLVCFARDTFAEGDLPVDFARRTGLPADALQAVPVMNTSLGAEAVAVLLCRHRHRGQRIPGTRSALLEALGDFGDTRLDFAPEALEALIAPRLHDVRWAEVGMGRPFPPPPVPEGPAWSGIPALRAHGEILRGPLLDWQRRVAPFARPAAGTVPAIIDATAHALTPRRGPLSLVRKAPGR